MESVRIDDYENIDTAAFEWEREYFEKFRWLDSDKTDSCLKYTVLQYLSKHLKIEDPYIPSVHHLQDLPLYLYYVELENNKMILHASFQKECSQILKECIELYEFARINPPIKVVYVQKDVDFSEVDMNVKLFMYMFGVDDTRGGSYKETILPDYVLKTLEREFQIMNMDHYMKQQITLGLY